MLTTFTLLVVTGGVLRLALGWGLHRRYQLDLSVPQALAGVLVMLAGLPDILKPFSFPLPLGFTLGLLFPDLLFRRDWSCRTPPISHLGRACYSEPAIVAQRDPYGRSERTNNIRNNPSSEILILIDDKEDIISSATPRTLASSDRSKEETTTEKTEPRKLGEVRFEDMF